MTPQTAKLSDNATKDQLHHNYDLDYFPSQIAFSTITFFRRDADRNNQ
jgi:hypothetical protein